LTHLPGQPTLPGIVGSRAGGRARRDIGRDEHREGKDDVHALTTHERMSLVYAHQEPDRVPITDWFWESTLERWQSEGMPRDLDVVPCFGLDDIIKIEIDTSPRFETKVIEETDTYRIERDSWGITKKNFKPISATFEHLDHMVKDRASWQIARARMTPASDRIDWAALERDYRGWRERGAWIIAAPWFGYDIVNARMCDTATILYAMADDPEWVKDMCNHGCDMTLALLDMLWDRGYTLDELMWFDDMAYKNGMLFSKAMWREIVRPYQQRTIDWAHAHGIKVQLHCCGRITELIPDLIAMGLDALNPMEVKAGMDPVQMKKQYGRDLVLRGGFDIQNWSDPRKAEDDIRRVLPAMMESGGYIFTSDHSVADSVSYANYQHIVSLVKRIGSYSR
jgi:uroporphyrinogen decarboxylase